MSAVAAAQPGINLYRTTGVVPLSKSLTSASVTLVSADDLNADCSRQIFMQRYKGNAAQQLRIKKPKQSWQRF